jgi:hypothetical protein
VLALALVAVRPTGDCGEYILMTRAFASHANPDFRVADAKWLARREKSLAGVASHLHRSLKRDREFTIGALRAPSGRYYSMHFWFYSLLAVPGLFLLELVAGPPLLALTSVNAAAALLAMAYSIHRFRGTWLTYAAPGAILLTAATFYLRFTGPEMLTAAGVLIACLAATRGEPGLGFLAAGVAATQNPSAAALFPFVAVHTFRLRRVSAAGSAPALGRRTLELALAGLLLALLPYAFFQLEYGVPSLLGKHATDFGLIGFERLWSFFFDLNQGMAPNLPGLFLGVSLLFALQRWSSEWLVRLLATVTLVLAIAVPTFAAPNWNSGSIVIMRYAYWTAMPLLALLLELAAALPWRRAAAVLATCSALQLAVLATNGIRGEVASYLRHGWLARTVLARAPAAYNPLPEIFIERTLGRETSARPEQPIVWPRLGFPKKVLLHERGRAVPAPECPGDAPRTSERVTRLADGWEYQNGPFRCAARPAD